MITQANQYNCKKFYKTNNHFSSVTVPKLFADRSSSKTLGRCSQMSSRTWMHLCASPSNCLINYQESQMNLKTNPTAKFAYSWRQKSVLLLRAAQHIAYGFIHLYPTVQMFFMLDQLWKKYRINKIIASTRSPFVNRLNLLVRSINLIVCVSLCWRVLTKCMQAEKSATWVIPKLLTKIFTGCAIFSVL